LAIHPTFPINSWRSLSKLAARPSSKIPADPTALVGHPFAKLIQIQIQIKANCEAKKPRSKLVDLAS
jgi:hypothetical protein